MADRIYRTSDLAKAEGLHPNTVRRYLDWGLLPPVERSANGYRVFTQAHLDCLHLARMVYSSYYPGKALRLSAKMMLETAIAGDWPSALDLARQHLVNVEKEIEQAESIVKVLEEWARTQEQGLPAMTGETLKAQSSEVYSIGQACELLGVTHDVLRNWERNGLIVIPRNKANGYRLIGSAELERLKIIRLLSHAGYSMMAMLRMFVQFDKGERIHLRKALDTPNPDEDVYMAADHWLTILYLQKEHSCKIIQFIQQKISANHNLSNP